MAPCAASFGGKRFKREAVGSTNSPQARRDSLSPPSWDKGKSKGESAGLPGQFLFEASARMARRGVGDSDPAAQLLGTFRVQIGGHTLHPGQGGRGKGRALGLAGRSAEQRRERGAGRGGRPGARGAREFLRRAGHGKQTCTAGGTQAARRAVGRALGLRRRRAGGGAGRHGRCRSPSAAREVDSVRGPP